ncbi:MAG: ATP-binding protein [Sedimenticola sp.]
MPLSHLRVDGGNNRGRLARRLVTVMLLTTVLVTLLATALQLVREYWQELEKIERHFVHLEQSNLDTIANNVWLVDIERLRLQINSITDFEDVTFAEVVDNEGSLLARSGGVKDDSNITRSWDLHFQYRGKSREIGRLTVSAELTGLYNRLLRRAWVILLVYTAVVGVIALLLYVLIYRLIGRPLERMAAYAREYDIEKRATDFTLERAPGAYRDELDDLANAFNEMTHQLGETVVALQGEIIERRQADKERRSSEARFEQLASTIDQVFWLIDWKSGKVIYVNPAYEEIWGSKVEELYNDPKNWTVPILPEDRPAVEAAFSRIDRGEFRMEYRIRRPDGELRTIFDRGYPVRDAHNRIYRVAGVAEDITERKRLAGELQQLNDELEERVQQRTNDLIASKDLAEASSRAKSAFLDNMSHELRTPLSAILGFCQLLERDQSIPGGVREYLGIIRDSGDKLLHLLNDLLEMANIESGRSNVEASPFSPRDVATSLLDLLKSMPAAEGLALQLDIDPKLPAVILSDHRKFRQILYHLLANAVKFTERGEVVLRMLWLPSNDGKPAELLCEVSDTGIGIARDDLGRIFNFFTQAGEEALNCGAGLGLAITRHYVNLMNGSIDVESEPGVGSRFTIYLSVQEAYAGVDTDVEGESGEFVAQEGDDVLELKAEDFSVLTREERKALLSAAIELNGGRVMELAANIEAQHPHVAAGIKRYMRNMTFTTLVRLLESSLE